MALLFRCLSRFFKTKIMRIPPQAGEVPGHPKLRPDHQSPMQGRAYYGAFLASHLGGHVLG